VSFGVCNERTYGLEWKFKLFKGNSLIGEYSTKHWLKNTITITDLDISEYTIEYTDLFRKTKKRSIGIDGDKSLNVHICLDELNTSTIKDSLVQKISERQPLQISFTSNGCFHSRSNSIIVKKTSGIYSAEYYVESKNKRKRIGSIELSESQLDSLRNFEKEFYVIDNNAGCTTHDTYQLKIGSTLRTANDGSCSWNGFIHLRNALFEDLDE